jgi:hypothetical protein
MVVETTFQGRNHKTIYNNCNYRVLAYRFYTFSPPVLSMGSYHKQNDFTYMDKRAWLLYCFRACIDAVARITEIRTMSAFTHTTLFCKKALLEL